MNECAEDARIRGEMQHANYMGWWQTVADLTTELNQHHKACPTCNPEASRELLASLFGGRVEVGR
jgi:hypothetical protein